MNELEVYAWNFMPETGKVFKLENNNSVNENKQCHSIVFAENKGSYYQYQGLSNEQNPKLVIGFSIKDQLVFSFIYPNGKAQHFNFIYSQALQMWRGYEIDKYDELNLEQKKSNISLETKVNETLDNDTAIKNVILKEVNDLKEKNSEVYQKITNIHNDIIKSTILDGKDKVKKMSI